MPKKEVVHTPCTTSTRFVKHEKGQSCSTLYVTLLLSFGAFLEKSEYHVFLQRDPIEKERTDHLDRNMD